MPEADPPLAGKIQTKNVKTIMKSTKLQITNKFQILMTKIPNRFGWKYFCIFYLCFWYFIFCF